MRLILSFLMLIIISQVSGQNGDILTFKEYMKIVDENHPVSFQASILDSKADAEKRMARGGFDPKIEGDFSQKSFDGKNYYSLSEGLIKVPTWFGVDVKAGYNRSNGEFLNNSDELPSRGLWNAGISVPLGKGLVIDNRRAALKRADIYRNIVGQKQILMVNKLLFDAANAYLDWQSSFAYLEIAREGENLARIRFEGTKKGFENGDKPAIDTLESFISLQTREIDLVKANQEFENSILALNNFMWIDGAVPLELEVGTFPEPIEVELYEKIVDSLLINQKEWLASHPELLTYNYKLDNLNLDQRLAREELKPDLRINYNPLVAVGGNSLFDQFNAENYKIGASFSYPILQRKQRGKIALNKLKIQNTELDRTIKNQELTVKLDTYSNNIRQSEIQYNLLIATVENYNNMLRAENRKFSVGESSVFLVNSRENKYLESRYKLVNTSRKILINKLTYLLFANGLKLAQ